MIDGGAARTTASNCSANRINQTIRNTRQESLRIQLGTNAYRNGRAALNRHFKKQIADAIEAPASVYHFAKERFVTRTSWLKSILKTISNG